jgi:hypothetical protein
MAAIFSIGERKARPGVYFRYENAGGSEAAGAINGICAAVIRADWGPLDALVTLESAADIAQYFGDGGTLGVARELFLGGAKTVFAARAGTGGTAGTLTLSTDSAEAITVTMNHPGTRRFTVTIRDVLADAEAREMLILDGAAIVSRVRFTKGGDEVAALIAASAGNEWATLAPVGEVTGTLAAVTQAEVTPGTNPTVNNDAYAAAFALLETETWNVIALDTTDTGVHALLQTYLNRLYDGGALCMGVIASAPALPLADKMTNAKAMNDYKLVSVGSGFVNIEGAALDGYLAAARIAGMIAAAPANSSVVHSVVTGAVSLTKQYTNTEYTAAIQSGLLLLSYNAARQVRIDSGVNTLVTPGADDDDGWKKIRRVKTRFELLDRINRTLDPIVGKINNDTDGQAQVIQTANGVCNTMAAEGKLFAGAAAALDPKNPPAGDEAWFVVNADDIDSMEKTYLTFRFRYRNA